MSRSTITCHTALPHVTRHYHMSHGTTICHTALPHFSWYIRIYMAPPYSHDVIAFHAGLHNLLANSMPTIKFKVVTKTQRHIVATSDILTRAASLLRGLSPQKIQPSTAISVGICGDCPHRTVSGFMMSAGTFAGTVPTGVHRGSCVGLA